MALPTGPLLQFGQIAFDPGYTSGMIDYKIEWLNAYAPGSGAYPIDLRGLSAAPRKDPVASWKYLLRADHTLEGRDAASDLELKISAITDALSGTYSYAGTYATFSADLPGTLGDLVVLDIAQDTAYWCFARLDSAEVKLKAGSIYAYEMPLSWHLLSDFQALA